MVVAFGIAMCLVGLGIVIGLQPKVYKKPLLQRFIEWLETK